MNQKQMRQRLQDRREAVREAILDVLRSRGLLAPLGVPEMKGLTEDILRLVEKVVSRDRSRLVSSIAALVATYPLPSLKDPPPREKPSGGD